MIDENNDDYYIKPITYALNHLLWSIVKQEDALGSSYSHLATAVATLYNLVPGFNDPKDKECNYVLTELLVMNDIQVGKITCDQGLKIMDDLDIYNASKEI
jgi:hypothetical protein